MLARFWIERRIAWRLDGSKADILADRDDNDFYLICNASSEAAIFRVGPAMRGRLWARVIDTARESPRDFLEAGSEELINPQSSYAAAPHSFVLLMSKS